MRKVTIKIIIIIIVIIAIVYTIYNVSVSKERKIDNQESLEIKEKIISTDIRIGIINFDSINPLLSNNNNIQNVSRLVFEPLINLSNDYKLEPCLATEWTKTDKKTYLIKLRENVKWQDGNKFDSDDVIFTINILEKEAKNSIYYYNIKNIKDIKKIDEYTIKIITNQEIPYFEYNLIFPIMSSKYFTNKNFNSDNKNTNPVGTGMYYISDNDKYNVILKKNTNWWGEKYLKLDTINLNLYDNINNALIDIKSDNVDLITTSLIDIDKYAEGIQCIAKRYIGRNYDYLTINCEDDILKNKEVRQAINYAINKETIIKDAYNGKYIKSEFPLDFGSYIYNENSEKIEYNLDKAKNTLEDANWKYNNKYWGKKINNSYKKIELQLLVNKNNKDRTKVAKLIKEQLEEIGIQISIVEKNETEYENNIKNKNYELALTGITYGYSPSLATYFYNDNIANYKNEEVIKKINEIENIIEEEERKKILSEIIRYYNEDVPYISLYYDSNTLIYSTSLRGEIKPNSYNIFYNIENWYREYEKN